MLLTRISLAFCVLGCAALLGIGASPGLSFGEGFLAFVCGLLGFAGSCIAVIVAAFRWRTRLARLRLTALHVAGLVLCALLARTTLPLSVRVLVSEPWLRPRAHALLRNPQTPAGEAHLIGLFFARSGAANGMVVFDTGDYGFWGNAGIVFAPTIASALDARAYSHLYGPWWRYRFHNDD